MYNRILIFILIIQLSEPRLALLLGRAVLVEVVELAAGEHKGAGPLAIRFLKGPLVSGSTPG